MRHTRRTIHAALTTGKALAAAAISRIHLLRYTLTQAADRAQLVVIDYVKEDGTATRRTIAPETVKRSKAGDLYVRAYDSLRDAGRSFRLDRIAAITETA